MNLIELEAWTKNREGKRGLTRKWKLDDFPPWEIPEPKWHMDFQSDEDCERTKAMIEFCTNYEPELFKTFYKWFKKERKEN